MSREMMSEKLRQVIKKITSHVQMVNYCLWYYTGYTVCQKIRYG